MPSPEPSALMVFNQPRLELLHLETPFLQSIPRIGSTLHISPAPAAQQCQHSVWSVPTTPPTLLSPLYFTLPLQSSLTPPVTSTWQPLTAPGTAIPKNSRRPPAS